MQILILTGDVEAPPQVPLKLTNSEARRGSWLIRHHRQPRRQTFHPDWKSSELSMREVEPYKALYSE
eukprot:10176465-Prorocentrum_lima.AAC.1